MSPWIDRGGTVHRAVWLLYPSMKFDHVSYPRLLLHATDDGAAISLHFRTSQLLFRYWSLKIGRRYHKCGKVRLAVNGNKGDRLTAEHKNISSTELWISHGYGRELSISKNAVPSLLVGRPGGSDEARAEILKAAAIAFNERGYDATSIDDVADALGASKGRIYHYYRSKADVFLDLHLESLRVLVEEVGGIANRAELSPTSRIREMCLAHAILVMTQINYQKATMLGLNRFLLSVSAPYQDAAQKLVNELRDEYENLFVSVIAEGVKAGEFRSVEPRFTTKPLLGALNYVANWYEEGLENSLGTVEEIANALADYCVRGLAIK